MALSITVNGGGTFSASMEEGPVSFTATLGAVPGPKGDTGATGPAGQNSVVAATAPILYDSGTQTVSIDPDPTFNSVTTGQLTVNNGGNVISINGIEIIFPDATQQTTAFVGEARKVYVTARNNSGSTIAAGKVVYLSGATGNKPTIALAQANAEGTSARVIGLTVESIANNADGKVIISGAAENIDTSAFTAGQTVYLSSSVAGGLQTTLPAAPLHGVVIGIVTRANPSVGSIEVFIQNYQELSELSDVNVSDKANNDGLFWEASSSTWRSKTIAEVLGLTPIALSSLSASAPISYNSGTGAFTFDSSGFLLKSDNLSGLASASTARTNLGLGTMATETASNYYLASNPAGYVTAATAPVTSVAGKTGAVALAVGDVSGAAPTASPNFTGNPTAPTPATSDNDTSIATTAFVNAYCPAASTTTAGKVELATDAEAFFTGTSTTLAVTPRNLLGHLYGPGLFIPDISGTQANTSTGTTAVGNCTIRVSLTATAAGQFAQRIFGTQGGLVPVIVPRGTTTPGANFNRHNILFGRLAVATGGIPTGVTARYLFGKSASNTTSYAPGDLSAKGFGIRITGTDVYLQVNDGTNLTEVLSSFTANASFDVVVESLGNGTVNLIINDTQVATTNAGPTGVPTVSYPCASIELLSTASSSATNVTLMSPGFWMP